MPTRRPVIAALDWDEENEAHVERHIPAWWVGDMIEGGDWVAFPNSKRHPPGRLLVVGRRPSGEFVTVVLRVPYRDDPGVWYPITGWVSTAAEREGYRRERERRRTTDG